MSRSGHGAGASEAEGLLDLAILHENIRNPIPKGFDVKGGETGLCKGKGGSPTPEGVAREAGGVVTGSHQKRLEAAHETGMRERDPRARRRAAPPKEVMAQGVRWASASVGKEALERSPGAKR